MVIEQLIQMYIALLLVITLHEIGHLPRKIKFKFGLIPSAVAMQARSRLGGLIVNVLIFSAVFYYQPENTLLTYMGLIAWVHFILYAVVGSIVPEKKASQVNIATHVFDDVPNEYAVLFISSAIAVIFWMQSYYTQVFSGAFA